MVGPPGVQIFLIIDSLKAVECRDFMESFLSAPIINCFKFYWATFQKEGVIVGELKMEIVEFYK